MRLLQTLATTTIILFFTSTDLYSCDCKNIGPIDSLRKIGYEISDIVFLGELVKIDTITFTYTFKIIEQFKGEYTSSIIKGKLFDSCSKFPRDKGKWIIYANIEKEEFINIDQCLGSRSEINPRCVNCYMIPHPLPPNASEKDKNKFENAIKALKDRAKEDWNNEIDWLRNK